MVILLLVNNKLQWPRNLYIPCTSHVLIKKIVYQVSLNYGAWTFLIPKIFVN